MWCEKYELFAYWLLTVGSPFVGGVFGGLQKQKMKCCGKKRWLSVVTFSVFLLLKNKVSVTVTNEYCGSQKRA